jgi:cysteine synthase A
MFAKCDRSNSSVPYSQTLILNEWQQNALKKLEEEYKISGITSMQLLGTWQGIGLYLKHEEQQLTGSHKHRLARSLLMDAISRGLVDKDTIVVEASSGSTARSEAYFAHLLGIPYIAVMAADTDHEKIKAVRDFGGTVELCESRVDIIARASTIAKQYHGYFLDQFTNATRATNYKENNIGSELMEQLGKKHPDYVVCGIGTGGTTATLKRHFEFCGNTKTKVIAGDPENSAFYDIWRTGDKNIVKTKGSRIPGIGRPYYSASFLPEKIERVIPVKDADSIAMIHWLKKYYGLNAGPSTGTNLVVCFQLMADMLKRGEQGAIVTFLCDGGHLYSRYYDPQWLMEQAFDLKPQLKKMQQFLPATRVSELHLLVPRNPQVSLAEPKISDEPILSKL